MFYILCLFNIITGFVIFDFMDKMYGRKYEKKLYIFVYFIFIGLHLAVNLMYVPAYNMCYEIVGINVLSYFLYKTYSKKFVYNLLFQLYLIFMDLITIPIYAFTFSLSFRNTLDSEQGMFLSGMLGYFIVICTYRLLIARFKNIIISEVSSRQDIFFLILSIFEIVITLYFGWIEMETAGSILIFVTIGFLALDLYIIHLFEFVSKHNILSREMALAEQQALMMNRNIHDLEHKYESSQKIIHDVRNYILTINGLQLEGDKNLLEKYTKQLTEKLDKLASRFQYSNKILTILINDKLRTAENNKIEFKLDIQDIDWNFILEIDLTTLFANLLDNAIEACEQVNDEDKFIKLRVAIMNSHIVLNISNSYVQKHVQIDGMKFISTKKGHCGIGLSNVKNVIDKYHGNMVIKNDENVFMVKIIIPIP